MKDDDDDEVYIFDGRSDDYRNCCMNKFLIQKRKSIKWSGSFGSLEDGNSENYKRKQ